MCYLARCIGMHVRFCKIGRDGDCALHTRVPSTVGRSVKILSVVLPFTVDLCLAANEARASSSWMEPRVRGGSVGTYHDSRSALPWHGRGQGFGSPHKSTQSH